MSGGDYLRYVLGVLLLVVLLALLLGQILGQPLLLTYVETDSMSPTINPNDGYVVLPPSVTGGVQEGDIILFEAEEINGGGLTTHRVVDKTEQGFITKGDNNPFTDQDGDEPPVSEGQIAGEALQIAGGPVVIPYLGVFVTGVQGIITGLTGAILGVLGLNLNAGGNTIGVVAIVVGLLLLGISVLLGTQRPRRSYSRKRRSFVLRGDVLTVLFVLVVLVPANASMILPAGTAEYSVLSSENPSEAPNVVQPGGELDLNYTVQNSGFIPLFTVVEPVSDGVTVDKRQFGVPIQSVQRTRVTLQVPEEPGSYPRFVHEYRYLWVLPQSWLLSLHRIHPLVALGAVNVVLGTLVATVSLATLGTGRVRVRSRSRDLPLKRRIRQFFDR